MRTVAALYIDPKGPYPKMPGVECWDESRDARLYAGPHPVVAHPPCGPWSRLKHFSRHQPKDCAPIAVEQVRRWGGVLEHPKASSLWDWDGLPSPLPLPGGLPDEFGGWSCEINQVSWGHPALKATWLYVVGVPPNSVQLLTGGTPTHCVSWGGKNKHRRTLKKLGGRATHLTPPRFAEFLVELARRCVVPAACMLSACSFDLPTDTVDAVADWSLLQTLPEPGPRPESFSCTIGDLTVSGDEPHVTVFHHEGFEPITVRSEDAITDVQMSGVLVIVVGDLLVVGERWVRLGEC